ncbi:MAG: hypothetical protein J6W70_02295, partial [Lentisphaeria bacterium]|nr:hypothetical protein [Lentisphaeria bacterium]
IPDTNAMPSDKSLFEETQDKSHADTQTAQRERTSFFTKENVIRDMETAFLEMLVRKTEIMVDLRLI